MKRLWLAIILPAAAIAYAGDNSKARNIDWIKNQEEVKALNCSSYKDNTYSNDYKKNDLKVNKGVFKKTPLFANGVITCSLSQNPSRLDQPIVSASEKAKLSQVPVEIFYSDGSGMVGKEYNNSATWFSKCSSDPMSDEVRCSVYQKDFSLVRTKDGYEVVIGGRNYPGSKAMFRSGKEKPINGINDASFMEKDIQTIIAQLSTGKNAVTRYVEWPSGTVTDNTLDASNFIVAKEFLDSIFENHI